MKKLLLAALLLLASLPARAQDSTNTAWIAVATTRSQMLSTSILAAAISPGYNYVRVMASTQAFLLFNASGVRTAVTSSNGVPIPANTSIVFKVPGGSQIMAVSGDNGGTIYITTLSQ